MANSRRRRRSPPRADLATPESMEREEELMEARRIARYYDAPPTNRVLSADLIDDCRHRDGSVYRCRGDWVEDYRIADRTETRFGPMLLSNPTNCLPDQETCYIHTAWDMLQIFSLKLAKVPNGVSPVVQLYGYFAARDRYDPSLNYVFNRSRDDPISVEQGSLIEMSGPKRGIQMRSDVLIEFDMKIKTRGESGKDDVQLIDGVAGFTAVTSTSCYVYMNRIYGDCGGAVDITVATLECAVEATIEVAISEVHESSFDLLLSCFVSGIEKEIQLSNGVISKPCELKRSVVAVVLDTWMDLKLKVCGGHGDGRGEKIEERCAKFKAKLHGSASQKIEFEQASATVKVTWSPQY